MNRRSDLLTLAIILYLIIPLGIFLAGWLRPIFGIPLILMLVVAISFAHKNTSQNSVHPPRKISTSAWLIIISISLAWVALSGLGSNFFSNGDWAVRYPVATALMTESWPVRYASPEGELTLRAPMGYYMVPGMAGKVFGPAVGHFALWFWTVLGVVLFLACALKSFHPRSNREIIWIIIVILLFSGMDIFGWMLTRFEWPTPGQHIEWWARLFQYSSNTTLLFWVPNHAIPGWLIVSLGWSARKKGLPTSVAALLTLGAIFWAPLVALMTLPLMLLLIWKKQRYPTKFFHQIAHPSIWLCIPSAIIISLFYTSQVSIGTGNGESTWLFGVHPAPWEIRFERFLIFQIFEWALLAAVLATIKTSNHHWLLSATVMLGTLPLVRFGPANDLVMRGGIIPITMLMFVSIQALRTSDNKKISWNYILISIFLLIGAITPYQEFLRSLTGGRGARESGHTLYETLGPHAWHYLAPMTGTFISNFLKL